MAGAFMQRSFTRGPELDAELRALRVDTSVSPPRSRIGLLTDPDELASAFDGCENRSRIAALILGARFTGTLQGLAFGAFAGVIAGAALYVHGRRKRARGEKR